MDDSKVKRQYAIGVDVGGTKINAGWISAEGEVLHSHTIPTAAGEVRVMDRILEAIWAVHALKDEVLPEGAGFAGIGVGTAGQVDAETGSIRFASDLLPGYTGTKVKQELEETFGVPVYVDNDVNVLALTELKLGAGRGAKHLICLALGTGVGGAIVVDGRIVHGAWGGAAELGHLSVDFNGLPCVCGGVGCLEQYASGTGIAKRMNMKLAANGVPGQHKPGTYEDRNLVETVETVQAEDGNPDSVEMNLAEAEDRDEIVQAKDGDREPVEAVQAENGPRNSDNTVQAKVESGGESQVATIDAKQVISLWQEGDTLATEVMEETFAALGAAIASIAHLFNPEVVVIGGGVAEAGEPIFERVREEAKKRGMSSFMDDLQIVPAFQGNWSGMIGAALQVWA